MDQCCEKIAGSFTSKKSFSCRVALADPPQLCSWKSICCATSSIWAEQWQGKWDSLSSCLADGFLPLLPPRFMLQMPSGAERHSWNQHLPARSRGKMDHLGQQGGCRGGVMWFRASENSWMSELLSEGRQQLLHFPLPITEETAAHPGGTGTAQIDTAPPRGLAHLETLHSRLNFLPKQWEVMFPNHKWSFIKM